MGQVSSSDQTSVISVIQEQLDKKIDGKLQLADLQGNETLKQANWQHLPFIWIADNDKDGYLSQDDFTRFKEILNKQRETFTASELPTRVSAECVLQFAKSIHAGSDTATEWIIKLISNTDENITPGFVGRESVLILYRILTCLGIEDDMDQQGFFCLLQECSEEMGLDSVDNESFDDSVSLKVISSFVQTFLKVRNLSMYHSHFSNTLHKSSNRMKLASLGNKHLRFRKK